MPNNDRQCPANFIRHTIQPGDTLYGIASFYGVSIASILLANPGINPYNLVVGTHICIPSPCPAGYRTHVVEPGDTLNRIAVQYNVSLQRILSANPGVNPSNLMIGQRLCIPPMCPEGFIEYTIRQGDTLFAIASRFGTTVQEILNANPLITDPASLRIGQRICIPAGCPEGFMEYTVREGDTLFAIASRFGTTVRELLDNNPLITDPEQLRVGQRICVPAPAGED